MAEEEEERLVEEPVLGAIATVEEEAEATTEAFSILEDLVREGKLEDDDDVATLEDDVDVTAVVEGVAVVVDDEGDVVATVGAGLTMESWASSMRKSSSTGFLIDDPSMMTISAGNFGAPDDVME